MIANQLAFFSWPFSCLDNCLLLPKEMGSGTAMGVCIKENETECEWFVLEEKELVTETESMSSTVTEKTKSLNCQRG
jgi:hypothetical protein